MGTVAGGDLDACVLEELVAAAVDFGKGVAESVVDRGDAGLDEGIGAGWGAAVVGAGLEGDVDLGATSAVAGGGEGHDLGVGTATLRSVAPGRSGGRLLGVASGDNFAVADDDGADGRVG